MTIEMTLKAKSNIAGKTWKFSSTHFTFTFLFCVQPIIYSLSPKIDAPKIDAFSENSRNFQNSKIFGELCQNLQFLVKNIFGVTLILYRYRVPTDLCL